MFTLLFSTALAQSAYETCVLNAQLDYQTTTNAYSSMNTIYSPMSVPLQMAACKYQNDLIACQGMLGQGANVGLLGQSGYGQTSGQGMLGQGANVGLLGQSAGLGYGQALGPGIVQPTSSAQCGGATSLQGLVVVPAQSLGGLGGGAQLGQGLGAGTAQGCPSLQDLLDQRRRLRRQSGQGLVEGTVKGCPSLEDLLDQRRLRRQSSQGMSFGGGATQGCQSLQDLQGLQGGQFQGTSSFGQGMTQAGSGFGIGGQLGSSGRGQACGSGQNYEAGSGNEQ